MATTNRPRKSPHLCELRDTGPAPCVGRPEVVLVDLDGPERRVCPAHAAALWLTEPTLRFSAKTRPEAIAAVMRHAFGEAR